MKLIQGALAQEGEPGVWNKPRTLDADSSRV